jgi:hypothetical protein
MFSAQRSSGMAKKSEKKKTNHPKTHSSISVSKKFVCEDEACIGKVVGNRNEQIDQAERQDKDRGKARKPGTSMSIGGKDACADDSCIGKV